MSDSAAAPLKDPTLLQSPRKYLGLSILEWVVVAAIIVVLAALLLPRVESSSSPDSRRRERCRNNLKSIGLALHLYHEKYGTAPPAYLIDKDGRPVHSWRVLILPFLDRDDLYQEYRFDEPWDGPHNQQLADKVGDLFHCPSDQTESEARKTVVPLETSYVAVIGPETYWRGAEGVCPCDVYDGMATTLQLVEVANSGIHWMEPRDLHVGQMAPTINPKAGQGISSRHKGGAIGLLADGSVRFLSEKLTAETIRGLLTIKGGETIPEDF